MAIALRPQIYDVTSPYVYVPCNEEAENMAKSQVMVSLQDRKYPCFSMGA